MRHGTQERCLSGDSLGLKSQRTPSDMSGKPMHPDHAEFFAALGRRIRELRLARGWSLRDMVLEHGYHVSQWQSYEKGSPVTVDSLLRMSTVFGLTLTQLIGDLGEFPRKDFAEGGATVAHAQPLKATAAKKTAKYRQKAAHRA